MQISILVVCHACVFAAAIEFTEYDQYGVIEQINLLRPGKKVTKCHLNCTPAPTMTPGPVPVTSTQSIEFRLPILFGRN